MSKTYTLHPIAIVHGEGKSNSYLSDSWSNLYNQHPNDLNAGSTGSWVQDASSGRNMWNEMHCLNFMFDQTTLNLLRTKGIQSVTFSTKVSGTLKGNESDTRHQIRYRFRSESGEGTTSTSPYWRSASDANATSEGKTIAGLIGSSTSSEETVSDQTISVTLENSIPKYGYVVGPASIYSHGTKGLLTFSSTLSDTTLTVVTDEIENYSVIYSGNGGDGAPPAQMYPVGASVTLSSVIPTRAGHRFLGWSENSAATTASYAAGSTQTFNANVTLYAVWSPQTYSIAFNANGGMNAPAAQTKTYGVDLTLTSSQPTRDGYAFLGWARSNVAVAADYASGSTYTENGNATLYAVWQVVVSTHTLTYDANGGTNAPVAQTQTYSVEDPRSFTVTDVQPNRDGYAFKGWSNTSDGMVDYAGGDTIPASADKTIYAVWEKTRFIVTYDANGGTSAPAAQTKQKGVPLAITDSTPQKQNAVFLGWATNSSAEAADYHGGDLFTTDADTVLYAVWEAVKNIRVFVVKNGVAVACRPYVVNNSEINPCIVYA